MELSWLKWITTMKNVWIYTFSRGQSSQQLLALPKSPLLQILWYWKMLRRPYILSLSLPTKIVNTLSSLQLPKLAFPGFEKVYSLICCWTKGNKLIFCLRIWWTRHLKCWQPMRREKWLFQSSPSKRSRFKRNWLRNLLKEATGSGQIKILFVLTHLITEEILRMRSFVWTAIILSI